MLKQLLILLGSLFFITHIQADMSADTDTFGQSLMKQGVEIQQLPEQTKLVLWVDKTFKSPSSSEPLDNQHDLLHEISQFIRMHCDGQPVIIAGHTDNVGSDADKLKLTHDQAEAIAAYMWSDGVPLQCIKVIGYGDTRPVSSNHTTIGSVSNRRVEISLPRG